MDWVCDDAWIGPFSQAMFYLGAAIGAIIFGYISDIYGRYPTFVASNVVRIICNCITQILQCIVQPACKVHGCKVILDDVNSSFGLSQSEGPPACKVNFIRTKQWTLRPGRTVNTETVFT